MSERLAPEPLPVHDLRWICDPMTLSFETTETVEPLERVVGQDAAVDALEFGLRIDAPGQHVFVRGPSGTGRMTLVRHLLENIEPHSQPQPDYCYVHNFEEPDRPRLLGLPRGQGHDFGRAIDALIDYIKNELAAGLDSDTSRAHRQKVEEHTRKRVDALSSPFDQELSEAGLTLVMMKIGDSARPLIAPVIDGQTASPEQVQSMLREEKITREEVDDIEARIAKFSAKLVALQREIGAVQREQRDALRQVIQEDARVLLDDAANEVRERFSAAEVATFVDQIIEDVLDRGLAQLETDASFTRRYQVNVVSEHPGDAEYPVIVENGPSVQTLLGTIDRVVLPDGTTHTDHLMVHGGALLRANGGYLIVDARDVVAQPGAWRALVRSLRSDTVDMTPPELPTTYRAPALKPEPIPIKVKVVLLGETLLYHLLDRSDPEFADQFKVLADFDSEIPRNADSIQLYAGYLAWLSRSEGGLPFDRQAVAAIAEHGARVVARDDKLTAKFGRLGDIAREAAFLARKEPAQAVSGEHVREAVSRTKRRADLPARRFRENIRRGSLKIQTRGAEVGQVNGLAVINAGPLTYGFPSRITATLGPGDAGTISIEREAQLSGAIHTKGFYILGGLLRTLLRTDHPLAFSASIAFEQSYGGIDGDSASGAEMCCLLSALTEIPLKQSLAMTGAIDQKGNILPIGAVNEKVEGFFDACADGTLDGSQGVVIPRANAGDLMLRHDVVDACRKGQFAVYAVSTIQEALELFMDTSASSILAQATDRAHHYWKVATSRS